MAAQFSGQKLRSLRLARGLTQAELAHRAHVRERQIIRWEQGQHSPRVESISALARVLDCTVADLLTGEPDEDDDESDPVADLYKAFERFIDHVQWGRRSAASESGGPG